MPTILLIDDNPTDASLLQSVLDDLGIRMQLHVARDGLEGLAFIQQTGQYQDAPRPNLVLLDLDLPRMNGFSVLSTIKTDATTRSIPVLILAGNDRPDDIRKAYQLHANCFVRKARNMEQLREQLRSLAEHWLRIATLPDRNLATVPPAK